MEVQPKYEPGVFLQNTIEDAKQIILMPEAGLTTEQRWEQETDWLAGRVEFGPGLVIDYGCGIGRVAKVLTNPVLGIDISPTMRAQAPDYVQRPEFGVTHPLFLRELVQHGLRASGALAFWCLQHCLDIEFDCSLLYDILRPGASLWTLDAPRRYVPATVDGEFMWADDRKSVDETLYNVGFSFESKIMVPEELVQRDCYLKLWTRE
jgi:SAM-dependent methyltransferase